MWPPINNKENLTQFGVSDPYPNIYTLRGFERQIEVKLLL